MENTEYLKQKKKKKKGRKIVWLVSMLLLVTVVGGLFLYQKKREEAEKIDPNARELVVLEENQSWQYLQIDNIIGNEIDAFKSDDPVRTEKEMKTYTIPVGTQVVTKLGSVTTFSRLAAGDTICCLMQKSGEEEVILKIWIEE